MKILRISIAVLFLSSLSFCFGCGGKKEYHTDKGTLTIEDKDEQKSVTFKSKDGDKSTTKVGSQSIPEEFPSDIPLLPDAKVLLSHVVAGAGIMLSFETKKGGDAVYDYYKSRLPKKGWNIESDVETMGVRMLSVRKGERTASVSLALHEGKTKVTLHISEKG